MTGCLGLLAACLVVSACASSRPLVNHGPPLHLVPPSPMAFRFSTASNRAFARRDVQKLLHIVVLPSSARLLTKAPPGAPRWLRHQLAHPGGASPGMAEARGVWLVHEPLARVMRFIRSHARATPHLEVAYPRGTHKLGSRAWGSFVFAAVPGRSWSRYLSFGATALHHDSTIVSVDAQESWNRASPRTDVLTLRIKRIDITSRYGNEPNNVLAHVHNPFDVASIVSWTNGLSDGPISICFGYFGRGPIVRLTFRSASGAVLAHAQVSDPLGNGISGPCNPLALTIGTRAPLELIGSDLVLRIQRLLNVNLAPVTPRALASCLRGWNVRHQRGNTWSVSHAAERWTVAFPASGNVTVTGPKRRALLRCMHPRFVAFG